MVGKRSAKAKSEPAESNIPDDNEIVMEEERVLNTYDDNSDYALTEAGPFDVAKYCKGIEVEVVNEDDDGMLLDFDLIHVEAPIANALRRVLLAEVPTMAFEKIYLYQNTSVIQDEVLCHRLGLLPIKADPRKFLMPTEKVIGINEHGVDCEEEPQPDPTRNLVFNINVTCTRNRNAPSTATEPHQLYHQSSVYSRSFKWIPCGDQEEQFKGDPPRIVFDDILVAKLRPGQQIEANCHAVKGIGRDHAKFSPVATASYRLLPTIRLLSEVRGEAAVRLKESFSEGVIELKERDGEKIAVVADARRDTCSRNVFRHDDLASVVKLGRKKNHFIFSVESTGALKSAELVVEACKISKPVADAVLRYGKDHPIFRNKILIPIGRGLVRLTTRLRMKRLGLGEPTVVVQVSESAALEQASDFVQQLVLFMYSVGVFSGYYFYTKITTPDTLKSYEFMEFREDNDKVLAELRLRVELLESALKKAGVKVPPLPVPPPPSPASDSNSAPSPTTDSAKQNSSQASSRFPRVSSLPVDAASNVILKGEARKSL
ncbi:RNA polymerase Rpb3/Rpb11 dimerization domain protein [Oesophagostomum dentatum]|uniref:DNA-directed RNA polymerases I and III subunit RPAC1 n=1 Tax=Oesophagostomum dentatum TaxID=61180 RepID=A0A0B1SPP6_OESDE|nr:RNA polymerase Rpb3/Rpb11 dimerization domain protein [Oesophagostomum dentatum]